MNLIIVPEVLGICKLSPDAPLPEWLPKDGFISITRTTDELSIVCRLEVIPKTENVESDWVAIKVVGPLDFSLTGILHQLTKPMAENNISIFAISTFNTDYILVKKYKISAVRKLLMEAGHNIS